MSRNRKIYTQEERETIFNYWYKHRDNKTLGEMASDLNLKIGIFSSMRKSLWWGKLHRQKIKQEELLYISTINQDELEVLENVLTKIVAKKAHFHENINA